MGVNSEHHIGDRVNVICTDGSVHTGTIFDYKDETEVPVPYLILHGPRGFPFEDIVDVEPAV